MRFARQLGFFSICIIYNSVSLFLSQYWLTKWEWTKNIRACIQCQCQWFFCTCIE